MLLGTLFKTTPRQLGLLPQRGLALPTLSVIRSALQRPFADSSYSHNQASTIMSDIEKNLKAHTDAAEGPRKFAGEVIPENMTRSAFKKLKKKEKMEADREIFIAKRKAKRREARKRNPHRSRLPIKHIDRQPSNSTVVIDCGFDEYMTVAERTSLAGQLVRCYSENRRCARPVNLIISGFAGNLKSRFENEMHATHKLWHEITFTEGDYFPASSPATVPPTNAVYLTGDAEEVLNELEPNHTYYVGGIVDKNRYTNLCLNKAKGMGIRTARLPIDEHIKVSGRRVLTTNQAFELLLKWLELRDWKLAFEAAIPARKIIDGSEPQDLSDAEEVPTPKEAEAASEATD